MPTGSTGTGDVVPFFALPHFRQNLLPVGSSAEQERQNLVKLLQQKFPGTGPTDWSSGAVTAAASRGSTPLAIPFDTENATNSADILAIGKKRWEQKFRDGKSFAHCFPNGGKRVAATYPQYDSKGKLVVTLEMALKM